MNQKTIQSIMAQLIQSSDYLYYSNCSVHFSRYAFQLQNYFDRMLVSLKYNFIKKVKFRELVLI